MVLFDIVVDHAICGSQGDEFLIDMGPNHVFAERFWVVFTLLDILDELEIFILILLRDFF